MGIVSGGFGSLSAGRGVGVIPNCLGRSKVGMMEAERRK